MKKNHNEFGHKVGLMDLRRTIRPNENISHEEFGHTVVLPDLKRTV